MTADKKPAPGRKDRAAHDPWGEFDRPQAPRAALPPESSAAMQSPAPAAPTPAPEAIEQLPPSKILPDPYQPRHPLLPEEIRARFQAKEISCYDAAREWLEAASVRPGAANRVLQDLLDMGLTLEDGGQINPLTGYYEQDPSGEYFFRIVTGERRFWATVLDFVKHLAPGQAAFQEPLIRVTCTPRPSPVQQIVENRHALIPSAVGQARGIAALVLYFLGERPPHPPEADTYAYFRNALRIHKPDGLWEKIAPYTRLKTRRMQALLTLLTLPTPLLDLADEYRLSSRAIEAVLANPSEEWQEQLLAAARALEERQRKAGDEEDDGSGEEPRDPAVPRTTAPVQHLRASELANRGIRRFQRAAMGKWRQQPEILDTVADQIYMDQATEEMIALLAELISRLEVRQQANSGFRR